MGIWQQGVNRQSILKALNGTDNHSDDTDSIMGSINAFLVPTTWTSRHWISFRYFYETFQRTSNSKSSSHGSCLSWTVSANILWSYELFTFSNGHRPAIPSGHSQYGLCTVFTTSPMEVAPRLTDSSKFFCFMPLSWVRARIMHRDRFTGAPKSSLAESTESYFCWQKQNNSSETWRYFCNQQWRRKKQYQHLDFKTNYSRWSVFFFLM